ncbi:MAG: hypothetical protein ABI467_32640 [Kofleriaceae bacterium]
MKLAILTALLGACTSITGGGGRDPVGSAGSAGSAAPTVKKSGLSLTAEMSKDGSDTTVAAQQPVDPKADPKAEAAKSDPSGAKGLPDELPKPDTMAPPSAFGTKDDGDHNSVPEPIVSHETGPQRPSDHRAHVDPGPLLGAIKLDMEPNWDRDFETPGTISFVLKVPNTTDTRVFAFHYGYDLNGAPTDRDAYKKFLADQKVLNVTLDRQRNAAWYLEGTDANGNPAFRTLVTFGGKRIVCGGSLYKDKASTALGPDLRDKVVNTAKKICESLAL